MRFGGSNDFLEAKFHGGCVFVEDLFPIQYTELVPLDLDASYLLCKTFLLRVHVQQFGV